MKYMTAKEEIRETWLKVSFESKKHKIEQSASLNSTK